MRRRDLLAPLLILATVACGEAPPEAPATGFDLVPHPDIALPAADMGKAPPPDVIGDALVLRIAPAGDRPSVRLPAGVETPIPDEGQRRRHIRQEADVAGRDESALRCSLLDVVLWADGAAPWSRVARVLRDCAEPEVRVDRVWVAVLDAAGSPALLPCFLPRSTGHRHVPPGPLAWNPKIRIGSSETEGAFEGRERLYAWFHRLRRECLERDVHPEVTIAPDAAAPWQRVVDILNEARRFGIEIVFAAADFDSDHPVAASEAWFLPDGPPDWSRLDPSLPPRRPGVSMAAGAESSGRIGGANRLYPGRDVPDAHPPWDPAEPGPLGRGLAWLARRQHGHRGWWEKGGDSFDPKLTGLVLLAFLGAGETHKTGSFQEQVKLGLKALKHHQHADGRIANPTRPAAPEAHACATLALSEAYAGTGSPLFLSSTRTALEWMGRWRDPSLAARGTEVLVHHSARQAGGLLSDSAWSHFRIDRRKLLDVEPSGQDEAVLIALCRRILGEVGDPWPPSALPHPGALPENPRILWLATILAGFGPPSAWTSWCEALDAHLLAKQITKGEEAGSWAPRGGCGRIESTALACLCLELRERYARVFGRR